MDNLTHTLFGAMLARTPLARAGRGTTAALLLASNAPDVDIVSAIGGSASYLRWHRGPTHGPLGVAALGVATAAIVWAADRLIARRSGARAEAKFGVLAAVSMIAVALHILMDLPTSYGTRVLSPFDWHWYAFDWLPIIDIYLLVILVLGVVFAAVSKASARRMAALVFVLMGVNYGLRATAHHQAVDRAAANLGPLLTPCDQQSPLYQGELAVWPRPRSQAVTSASGSCLVEVAAVPTFVSPFRWRIIAQLTNGYELRELNLLDTGQDDGSERIARLSIRYPNVWTPAVSRAAATGTASVFLGFSRFPSARSFTDRTGTSIVRWSDMRFAGGLFTLQNRGSRPEPFNVTVRLSPDGRVVEERMGEP